MHAFAPCLILLYIQIGNIIKLRSYEKLSGVMMSKRFVCAVIFFLAVIGGSFLSSVDKKLDLQLRPLRGEVNTAMQSNTADKLIKFTKMIKFVSTYDLSGVSSGFLDKYFFGSAVIQFEAIKIKGPLDPALLGELKPFVDKIVSNLDPSATSSSSEAELSTSSLSRSNSSIKDSSIFALAVRWQFSMYSIAGWADLRAHSSARNEEEDDVEEDMSFDAVLAWAQEHKAELDAKLAVLRTGIPGRSKKIRAKRVAASDVVAQLEALLASINAIEVADSLLTAV